MRKKFEGKTAEEILEKHGLGTIRESMATAEADLLKLGLTKLSIAPFPAVHYRLLREGHPAEPIPTPIFGRCLLSACLPTIK